MKKTTSKKKIHTILLTVCILFVLLIFTFIGRMIFLMAPTEGEAISTYAEPKSALLVIDVQNDTLSMPQFKNKDTTIEYLNAAIAQAESQGMEIIYIRQEYSNPVDFPLSFGMYQKGSKGAALSSDITMASDVIFPKFRSDAFSNKDFESYLVEHQIDTLYLTGAESTACVYKTALGGVNRNYRVIALKDSIFCMNEKAFPKILQQYQKKGIEIQTSLSE